MEDIKFNERTFCTKCGEADPIYVHRKSNAMFCKHCWDEMMMCLRCKKIAIEGIVVSNERYCWDCYLKEWGIKRRRPTPKDAPLLRKLAKPIWEQ